ncbi:MAG: nuclear transport factor 2 family protein [Aphanocapsa sp. GSE-SYN-MK-11-07L]|jgi:hypothetical protein|nr:nuclear transport factor 2 family protein [Aphanocapsa sp. GSE-SYN-MK-11-07L]
MRRYLATLLWICLGGGLGVTPISSTFGLSSSPPGQVTSPTKAEVENFFQQLAKAWSQKDRNPDQIIEFYAPDCDFEITIANTGQSVRLDRQQYYQTLQSSLQNNKAHSYQQAIAKIHISGQQAIVQATVTERITYASGLSIRGISQLVSVVKKRDGKLVITQVTANTQLEPE